MFGNIGGGYRLSSVYVKRKTSNVMFLQSEVQQQPYSDV